MSQPAIDLKKLNAAWDTVAPLYPAIHARGVTVQRRIERLKIRNTFGYRFCKAVRKVFR